MAEVKEVELGDGDNGGDGVISCGSMVEMEVVGLMKVMMVVMVVVVVVMVVVVAVVLWCWCGGNGNVACDGRNAI